MSLVYVTQYTHIDWHDMIAPASIVETMNKDDQALPCTADQAHAAFLEAGWEGDGKLGVIWLPPFLFEYGLTEGVCIWHVKQSNNGVSWLLANKPYDFIGLREGMSKWHSFTV